VWQMKRRWLFAGLIMVGVGLVFFFLYWALPICSTPSGISGSAFYQVCIPNSSYLIPAGAFFLGGALTIALSIKRPGASRQRTEEGA